MEQVTKQILGVVDKNTIKKYNIPAEFTNKKIVLYSNDKRHCEKRHLKDFPNKNNFYYVLANLDYIFQKPDFVYYHKSNDTLEYYRTMGEDISVRVRIENSPEFKIKTFFPVEPGKIEERKQKAIEDKYIINND